jgi:hypothetical protein
MSLCLAPLALIKAKRASISRLLKNKIPSRASVACSLLFPYSAFTLSATPQHLPHLAAASISSSIAFSIAPSGYRFALPDTSMI